MTGSYALLCIHICPNEDSATQITFLRKAEQNEGWNQIEYEILPNNNVPAISAHLSLIPSSSARSKRPRETLHLEYNQGRPGMGHNRISSRGTYTLEKHICQEGAVIGEYTHSCQQCTTSKGLRNQPCRSLYGVVEFRLDALVIFQASR